jgi:hypothetical protein
MAANFADAAAVGRPNIRLHADYSRNAIVHHGRPDRGVSLIQKPVAREAVGLRVREVLDA